VLKRPGITLIPAPPVVASDAQPARAHAVPGIPFAPVSHADANAALAGLAYEHSQVVAAPVRTTTAAARSPSVGRAITAEGPGSELFGKLVEAFTPNPVDAALLAAYVRGHWGGPRFTLAQYAEAVRFEKTHEDKPLFGIWPNLERAIPALVRRGLALKDEIKVATTHSQRTRLEGALSATALVLWITTGGGDGGVLPGAPRWGH
jgi:hypothetical protein